MQVLLNINGFETPVEFPDMPQLAPVVTGNWESWAVTHSNGLKLLGGEATITFNNVDEATTTVQLSVSKLLDFQVTPMDITGPHGETAHIEIVDDHTVHIYGRTKQAYTGEMKVKWSAVGVV